MDSIQLRKKPLQATIIAVQFLSGCYLASSFFSPANLSFMRCPARGLSGTLRVEHVVTMPRRQRTKGEVSMERPRGKFQRLTKPKFDRSNPSAVLGDIKVPGLDEVSALSIMMGFDPFLFCIFFVPVAVEWDEAAAAAQ